jgi:hypothetical protein
MNTAEQIKYFYKGDVTALTAECELKSVSVSQDWELESTTYVFPDNSVLVIHNSDVDTYGALS